MCGALSCVARGSWGLGDVLGATWSGIGLSWMPLEPIGEGLGGLLGSSWGLLGGSRRPLEVILVSPSLYRRPRSEQQRETFTPLFTPLHLHMATRIN